MSRKVLLVDDEPDLLTIGRFKLKKLGYDVSLVTNGRDALEECQRWHPDIVILDVMMPEMNGFEVCRKLKENGYQGKIIIYTAKIEGVDSAKAREAGADEFTVKTAGFELIEQAIGNLLSS